MGERTNVQRFLPKSDGGEGMILQGWTCNKTRE